MRQLVKQALQSTPVYHPIRNWDFKQRQQKALVEWQANGRPAPPPHAVKQQTLRTFAERFGIKVLVETGTYLGDMVEAMRDQFDQIYTIELSEELYKKAQKRFANASNVNLICGDSAVELANIVHQLNQPALFWLDGHYSCGITAQADKDTPIYEELSYILDAPDLGHVIIIDDARAFGVDADYPTIAALSEFVRSKRPNLDISVQDDSIRITPKK
jgi:hypothetical protein